MTSAPTADGGMVAPASVEPLLVEHAELERKLADPTLHDDQNQARRIGALPKWPMSAYRASAPVMVRVTALRAMKAIDGWSVKKLIA